MLLAIISDSHDNLPNLKKFLAWTNKNDIKMIIHCGDIASAETVDFLTKNTKALIHFVYGNMDNPYRDAIYELADKLKNAKLHGDEGKIILKKADNSALKIGLVHFPDQAREMAKSDNYDLVFYGHTHKPWLENIGSTQLINPGTLAGLFNKASFAVYDTETGNLELKILEKI